MRFSIGLSNTNIKAVIAGTIAKIIKKNDIEYSAVILSIVDPNSPAMKLAIAEAPNQHPNNRPSSFLGDSFDTYDNPTGDKHNSPEVWKK